MTFPLHWLQEFWTTTATMAPWLLAGFAFSIPLAMWLRPEWLRQHLGGGGVVPVAKAVLLGAPMPLCSCSVLPVTTTLYRQGAGKGPSIAFLLTTPQSGLDAILAVWGVFGPLVSLTLLGMTLLSGLVGGLLVSWRDGASDDGRQGGEAPAPRRSFPAAARYALVDLPGNIGGAMLTGLALAALLSSLLPQDALSPYLGNHWWALPLMLAASIPFYVCTIGSIPLAASFVALGASPGAAVVFLIAGPGTNAAALAVLWKTFGRRTTLIYLGTIAGAALAAGAMVNLLAARLSIQVVPSCCHEQGEPLDWLHHLCGALFLALIVYALVRKAKPTR